MTSVRIVSIGVATVALAIVGLRAPAASAPSPAPAVIVVVIDGLEREDASPALMPNLYGLMNEGEARSWTNAQAIMVTETNPNHTAMLTGTYGDVSGLFANRFFNLRSGAREAMERPSLILSPTLFDAIEAQKPLLRTASIMGKEKLRRLFDCTETSAGVCGPSIDNPEGIPVTHVRPDFVGGASTSFDPDVEHDAPAEPASGSGYSVDNQIMAIVIAQHTASVRPDFTFVNLSDVDGFEHLFGARSPQAMVTVANADANIGLLVAALKQKGRWADTVLFVTADHSFQDTGNPLGTDQVHVGANPVTPQVTGTLLVLPEILGSCSNGVAFTAVSNGGSAAVYITEPGYDPYAGAPLTQGQKDCLRELRARALAKPGVDEALYRVAVESDPATLLSNAHPEWRLGSPRAGELFLTASDTSSFTDSRTSTYSIVPGNHGGPTALPIPFFVASGSSLLVPGSDETHAVDRVDLAPTVAWLLGISPPAASEGRVVCEAFSASCP